MNVDRVCSMRSAMLVASAARPLNIQHPMKFTTVDFFSPALLYRRCRRSDEVALPQTLQSGDPDPAGGGVAILFNEDFPTKGNEECNVRR
ncbi:hypothetical protein ALC57_04172 [Trachymyrmex cornetzi]|uniref:Uncharacterized protein n=1 Tax=Trachymyrmex cornetzi TaxID=471704 RepID=A0A195EEM6_9HYME|nr:hypothetical protein ALC57_04172 [Trachymyrmex cornetzi]